jgi:hypothetical protein
MVYSLGYFTFYNSNGQSIVDYMIASHSIFYDIEHFIVHSPVEFSDHCLISVYMKKIDAQKKGGNIGFCPHVPVVISTINIKQT